MTDQTELERLKAEAEAAWEAECAARAAWTRASYATWEADAAWEAGAARAARAAWEAERDAEGKK